MSETSESTGVEMEPEEEALKEAYRHQEEEIKKGQPHDIIIGNEKITCKNCGREWTRDQEESENKI